MADHGPTQPRAASPQHRAGDTGRAGRTGRALVGLAAGAGVLLLAAGCGSSPSGQASALPSASATTQPSGVAVPSGTPTASGPVTSTVTNTVTSTPKPSGSPTGPSSPSGSTTPNGVAECDVNALHLTLTGGDAGMSHQYWNLVLTNIGSQPCRTGGFGGVSMVGGGNGTQIGAPAVREGDAHGRFTLQPGQKMTSQLSIADAAVYPSGHCVPSKVDGLRVYPPNSTKSLYVASATTGCRNTAVKLMQQQAFQQA